MIPLILKHLLSLQEFTLPMLTNGPFFGFNWLYTIYHLYCLFFFPFWFTMVLIDVWKWIDVIEFCINWFSYLYFGEVILVPHAFKVYVLLNSPHIFPFSWNHFHLAPKSHVLWNWFFTTLCIIIIIFLIFGEHSDLYFSQ